MDNIDNFIEENDGGTEVQPVNVDSTESVVEAMMPVFDGDEKKTKYLSYRAANFSVEEACRMTHCHPKSVSRWRREDSFFKQLDTAGLDELREKTANKVMYAKFSRNMQVVLDMDFQVFANYAEGKELTEQQYQYLLKARALYTPQQLAVLFQLSDPVKNNKIGEFNFTGLTLTIKREKEEIQLGRST